MDSLVTAESAVILPQESPCTKYSWSFYPLSVSFLKFNLPSALCTQHIFPSNSPLYFRGIFGFPVCIEIASPLLNQKMPRPVCELDLLCIKWLLCESFLSYGRARINKESIFTRAGQKFNPIALWVAGWVANTGTCLWLHHKAGNILAMGSTRLLPSFSLWNLHLCQTPTTLDEHTMEMCSSKPLSNELWMFMVPTDAASPALGCAGVRHNTELGGWEREVCAVRLKAKIQFGVASVLAPRHPTGWHLLSPCQNTGICSVSQCQQTAWWWPHFSLHKDFITVNDYSTKPNVMNWLNRSEE